MFSTKNVKESGPTNKWIKAGLNQNVTLKAIEGTNPGDGKSPYLSLWFYMAAGTAEDAREFRLYMSEKAQPKTLEKIVHLATKVTTREAIDGVEGSTIEEYAAGVNSLLKGATWGVMKFTGEEYENINGEKRTKAKLGFPPFAEGPESTLETTKLTYDTTNQWDFTPLPTATSEEMLSSTTETGDLPF